MTVGLRGREISIEKTGQSCQVSDDPIGRLQYYLNCVKSCIPRLSSIPTYLTDYANSRNLNREQRLFIVHLADQFDLQTMVQLHVFIPDFSADICVDHGNEFFKITDRRVAAIATSSVVIAGQQVETTSLMLFTEQWARTYYLEPLKAAAEAIIRADQEAERRRREQEESARRQREKAARRQREQEESARRQWDEEPRGKRVIYKSSYCSVA
jgi:hypothetical protein